MSVWELCSGGKLLPMQWPVELFPPSRLIISCFIDFENAPWWVQEWNNFGEIGTSPVIISLHRKEGRFAVWGQKEADKLFQFLKYFEFIARNATVAFSGDASKMSRECYFSIVMRPWIRVGSAPNRQLKLPRYKCWIADFAGFIWFWLVMWIWSNFANWLLAIRFIWWIKRTW